MKHLFILLSSVLLLDATIYRVPNAHKACNDAQNMALLFKHDGIIVDKLHRTPFSGVACAYYENNQPKSIHSFKNGLPHGFMQTFDTNTALLSSRLYHNGVLFTDYNYTTRTFVAHKKYTPYCENSLCTTTIYDNKGYMLSQKIDDANETLKLFYDKKGFVTKLFAYDAQGKPKARYDATTYTRTLYTAQGGTKRIRYPHKTYTLFYDDNRTPLYELMRYANGDFYISYYYGAPHFTKAARFFYTPKPFEKKHELTHVTYLHPNTHISIDYYFKNDRLISESMYDTIQFEAITKPDRHLLYRRYFYPNGITKVYQGYRYTKDGTLAINATTYWDNNGTIHHINNYKDGMLYNGIATHYDKNGYITYQCPYQSGNKNGVCLTLILTPIALSVTATRYIDNTYSGTNFYLCPTKLYDTLNHYDKNLQTIKHSCTLVDTLHRYFIPY